MKKENIYQNLLEQEENIQIIKYLLRKEEFGNGGFGRVILAENEEEKEKLKKRLYIIKIPLPNKLNDIDKKNFDNEIKII